MLGTTVELLKMINFTAPCGTNNMAQSWRTEVEMTGNFER